MKHSKIFAQIIKDSETGLSRWFLKGRFNIGSWSGPAPVGGVVRLMGSLNLKTGEYKLHGPKGLLPVIILCLSLFLGSCSSVHHYSGCSKSHKNMTF